MTEIQKGYEGTPGSQWIVYGTCDGGESGDKHGVRRVFSYTEYPAEHLIPNIYCLEHMDGEVKVTNIVFNPHQIKN